MANPENLLQAFGQSYLEKQRSSPTFLRAPSEVNSKPLADDRASRPISSASLLLRSTKARWPRPTGRPLKPLANQGEEGETNIPDQERLANQYLYLVNRMRRPMVQNHTRWPGPMVQILIALRKL